METLNGSRLVLHRTARSRRHDLLCHNQVLETWRACSSCCLGCHSSSRRRGSRVPEGHSFGDSSFLVVMVVRSNVEAWMARWEGSKAILQVSASPRACQHWVNELTPQKLTWVAGRRGIKARCLSKSTSGLPSMLTLRKQNFSVKLQRRFWQSLEGVVG
jgi:hypothetical protein